MSKLMPLLIVISLILAACSSSQATVSVTQAPASPTEAPVATLPSVSTPTETAGSPAQSPNAPGETGLETYTISALNSAVTYQVGEIFINENNRINTAVGVTKGISGKVDIDRANPQNSQVGPVTIDISQFTSDSNRRDNAIRSRFLESGKYPQATFVTTQIEGLPATIEDGKTYPLKISGDLTIREITKPVMFDANVRLDQSRLSGQAGTTLLMSDFGFGPISIAGILKTDDQVNLAFEFVALRSLTQ